jgi:hypothetical protein
VCNFANKRGALSLQIEKNDDDSYMQFLSSKWVLGDFFFNMHICLFGSFSVLKLIFQVLVSFLFPTRLYLFPVDADGAINNLTITCLYFFFLLRKLTFFLFFFFTCKYMAYLFHLVHRCRIMKKINILVSLRQI